MTALLLRTVLLPPPPSSLSSFWERHPNDRPSISAPSHPELAFQNPLSYLHPLKKRGKLLCLPVNWSMTLRCTTTVMAGKSWSPSDSVRVLGFPGFHLERNHPNSHLCDAPRASYLPDVFQACPFEKEKPSQDVGKQKPAFVTTEAVTLNCNSRYAQSVSWPWGCPAGTYHKRVFALPSLILKPSSFHCSF